MEVDLDKTEGEIIGDHKFEMDGLTLEFKDSKEKIEITWRTATESGKFDNDALFALAFLIANPAQQDALIPIKTEERRVFRQVKRVKLTKDMKAGSEINVGFKFTVPVEMLLAASQGGLYVPKTK